MKSIKAVLFDMDGLMIEGMIQQGLFRRYKYESHFTYLLNIDNLRTSVHGLLDNSSFNKHYLSQFSEEEINLERIRDISAQLGKKIDSATKNCRGLKSK